MSTREWLAYQWRGVRHVAKAGWGCLLAWGGVVLILVAIVAFAVLVLAA